MNQNKIRLDGFSNPDTGRHFSENWTEERQDKEIQEEKSCVFCCWSGFLGRDGTVLCLNPDCPYCYESLALGFSCHQQRTA